MQIISSLAAQDVERDKQVQVEAPQAVQASRFLCHSTLRVQPLLDRDRAIGGDRLAK